MIEVHEEALQDLKNALETAGEDYKANLARLTALIEEITRGDIRGNAADQLLAKFQEKQDIFNALTRTIEDAEEYTGAQKTKFANMMDTLNAAMK